MSPGLKRAREPYRIRNAIVGLGLGAFAAGVWAYSISAVKQDVFDDVDEEAQALQSQSQSSTTQHVKGANATGVTRVGAGAVGGEGLKAEENSKLKAENIVVSEPLPPTVPAPPPPSTTQPANGRGILQCLDSRWPGLKLLDPQSRTFVWGAPSVDNVGKMRS
ncbi:hypothetical protein CC1G_01453 [Coprinopsis cinerea okayama7|uniref:Cytochrome c oxidase assembly factor 3 n=1 Tax=Coprinopsis cinerea (strain Okayama-7 / 130 / ATCC MYA-4618 / FGSC 9003) TaxID=240176 RepID=A8NYW3_COPC7|nr:hypothetical protein CC1G_01453 [Coprinopsis cinerea okayama7\|eukprot:XP_001837541.1 hypothetical protein CC1G_01453 [Coprinopsis cinerea okayama7\